MEEKVNDSSYEENDSEVEVHAMTKFLLAAQQEDFRFSTVSLAINITWLKVILLRVSLKK